jgi:predicted O-methyltransferase YrrM
MQLTVRSKIHRRDPYEDFDASKYAVDMQGWGSNHQVFSVVLKKVRPELIVELGTWKGGSAIHMANITKSLGLSCEIACIDTWLGSPQIYMRRDDQFYASLNHVNGYPSLYYTFLKNVVHSGHSDVITPIPMASEHAAMVLSHFGVKADILYIDAAHDYLSVKSDLERYWPLLKDGGVLIGDDYRAWPGVTKASTEFAGHLGIPIYATHGKYIIPKDPKFDIGVTFS